MDRYYKANENMRTKRNEDLYKSIYSNEEYSNIEGVAAIEKTNEIDITKVKEMLKNREEYKKMKKYNQIIQKKDEMEEETEFVDDDYEEKSYDIRDVLDKAKSEKKETDKYHNLENLNLDVLNEIDFKNRLKEKKEESQELHDLIDNITNTSMLNKVKGEDLSLDLLSNLKSDNENTKTIDVKKEMKEMDDAMDESFFTSRFGFTSKDFENLQTINDEVKKNNKLIKILIIILIIIILIVGGFYLYKTLK